MFMFIYLYTYYHYCCQVVVATTVFQIQNKKRTVLYRRAQKRR